MEEENKEDKSLILIDFTWILTKHFEKDQPYPGRISDTPWVDFFNKPPTSRKTTFFKTSKIQEKPRKSVFFPNI